MMASSTSSKKPGLSMIEDELIWYFPSWYVGALSERKAENVLMKSGGKGSFLVRDCLLPDADYILSVNGGKDIDHYQIKVAPNNECILNNYTFPSLTDAIEFYCENRLGSVFLELPEEPVVAVPIGGRGTSPNIRIASPSLPHQPAPSVNTTPPQPAKLPSQTASASQHPASPQNVAAPPLQSVDVPPTQQSVIVPPSPTVAVPPPQSPPQPTTTLPPQPTATPPPHSPPQPTATPPPQPTATSPPQPTATLPPQPTATPPPQPTATPPPQPTATPPPQPTATPPPQPTATPPPQPTATPPPQPTAAPPPQPTTTPPPQPTATPPPHSPPQPTATPPPQPTATPPPHSPPQPTATPPPSPTSPSVTAPSSTTTPPPNTTHPPQDNTAVANPPTQQQTSTPPVTPTPPQTALPNPSTAAESLTVTPSVPFSDTEQTTTALAADSGKHIAYHEEIVSKEQDDSTLPSSEQQLAQFKVVFSTNNSSAQADSAKENMTTNPGSNNRDSSTLNSQVAEKETNQNAQETSNIEENNNEATSHAAVSHTGVSISQDSESSAAQNADTDATNASPKVDSDSPNTQTEPLRSPTNTKAEKQNELNSLPSILAMRKALEQQMGVVEKETDKKPKKVPPPVPKRKTSVKTTKPNEDAAGTRPQDQNMVEPNTGSDEPSSNGVVKASVTTAPPPPPKKLLIPQMFNNKEEEDQKPLSPGSSIPKKLAIPQNFQEKKEQDKPPEKTSPPEIPKRVAIPESLQNRPLPPPLKTHPELIKKEEKRQHQLLQAEMDKLQSQKSKKRRSIFRKKSDKEKFNEKRTSSIIDEPITLEEARMRQQQEESKRTLAPSPSRPKKVIGVPTLGMSPDQLEASGGSSELQLRLRNIRQQEDEKQEVENEEQITFCQIPVKIPQTPVEIVPKNTENQTSSEYTLKQENSTVNKKEDGDAALSTFGKPSSSPGHKTTQKHVTSRQARPKRQANVEEEISVSTFGQPSIKVSQSTGGKQNTETPNETKPRNDSIVEVGTFKPNDMNKPSPVEETIEEETTFFTFPDSNNEPRDIVSSSSQQKSPGSPNTGSFSPNSGAGSPYLNTSPLHSPNTSPTHSSPKSPTFSSQVYQTMSTSPPSASHQTSSSPGTPNSDVKQRMQQVNGSPNLSGKSQSVSILPGVSGFTITTAGNPNITTARHGLGRQHSIAEVVPGIPHFPRRLPPQHYSVDEGRSRNTPDLGDQANMQPGKSAMAPVSPLLMNSKRIDKGGKKRGNIFKRK